MLLNPAKPKHFILLSHFHEITQAFLEFLGAFSGRVNEGDANPLVGVC